MARPCKESETVRVKITLSLTVGEDDDLITWFDSLPERGRATAVKVRLRTGKAPMADSAIGMSDDDVAKTLASLLL